MQIECYVVDRKLDPNKHFTTIRNFSFGLIIMTFCQNYINLVKIIVFPINYSLSCSSLDEHFLVTKHITLYE